MAHYTEAPDISDFILISFTWILPYLRDGTYSVNEINAFIYEAKALLIKLTLQVENGGV